MKINIDGSDYELNVADAISDGNLKKRPKYPLRVGDVYKHQTGDTNSFLLVQCVYYGHKAYQLLGFAVSPNSNSFFDTLHTLEEIEKYLAEKNMVFTENITDKINILVRNCNI